MRGINYVVIFLIIGFYACNRADEENNSKVINLKDAKEVKGHHVLRDFIESIEIIPLETSDSIVVGYSKSLMMTKERIYVYDYKSKAVHIFSSNGDFINTLCRVGKGPNEYLSIKSFYVDGNDNLSILCYRKILKFDKDLNLIAKVKIPDKGKVHDFIDFDENKFCIIRNCDKETKPNTFLYCIEKGNIVKKYGKSKAKDVTKKRAIKYGNTYNITPSFYSNKVLNIDKDFNITTNYTVLFGEEDYAKKALYRVKMTGDLKNYQMFDFIETDEYVMFNYQAGPVHHCVYNKVTKRCLKGINTLTNKKYGFPLRLFNVSLDGNYLLGISYSTDLIKYIKDIKTDVFIKPEELDKLKNIKVGDNPVVFKVKLKSQDIN